MFVLYSPSLGNPFPHFVHSPVAIFLKRSSSFANGAMAGGEAERDFGFQKVSQFIFLSSNLICVSALTLLRSL